VTDAGRLAASGRVLLAAALIAVAAFVPTLVGARAANEIPTLSASQEQARALSQPTAAAWNDAPPVSVPLSSAPSTVPNANDTSIDVVNVQAARSDTELFVRLSWADGTRDPNAAALPNGTPQVDTFGDAAAVQLPTNASAQPGIAMGSPASTVNVWWWNRLVGSQEVLAGGPGTVTRFPNDTVSSNATYRDGRWFVVFERNLSIRGENRTALDANHDLNVAFAVWNGSNMERSGRKSVSEWHYFPFGPGPQGPPYETALWIIAGVAIVVVVSVTVEAVRRGG